MIDLDHCNDPAVVDNRCGKIRNILHEVAVDKDLVLLEHTLQIRMILHAQRARQLVGAVAEAYLLAQIVAALADHIDHDVLDTQDLCRHGCRLRIEILRLNRVQTRGDAVEAANAVVRIDDLTVETILDGNALLEQILKEGDAVLQATLDPPIRTLAECLTIGKVARQHGGEKVGNKVEELLRTVEERHEIPSLPEQRADEDHE